MSGRLGGASARRAGSLPASARTIAQRQRVTRALPPTLICPSCVFDQTLDHTPKLSRAAQLPWPRVQQDGGLRPGTKLFKQRPDRLGTPIHSSEQAASAGPGCGRARAAWVATHTVRAAGARQRPAAGPARAPAASAKIAAAAPPGAARAARPPARAGCAARARTGPPAHPPTSCGSARRACSPAPRTRLAAQSAARWAAGVFFWLLSCPPGRAGFAAHLEPRCPIPCASACACRHTRRRAALPQGCATDWWPQPFWCARWRRSTSCRKPCAVRMSCRHPRCTAQARANMGRGSGPGGSALAAVGVLPVCSDGGGGGEQRVAVGGGRRLVGYQPDRVRQPLHALLLRGLPRARALSAATPAAGAPAALGSWSGVRRIGGCANDVPCAEAKGAELLGDAAGPGTP